MWAPSEPEADHAKALPPAPGSFHGRCGEFGTRNPGANRLAAMGFRFLPTVGMTGRGGRNGPSTGSGRSFDGARGDPSTGFRMILRRAQDERRVGGGSTGSPRTGDFWRFLRCWDFWGLSGTFSGVGGVRRGRGWDAKAVGRRGVACGRALFCGGGSSPGSRRRR